MGNYTDLINKYATQFKVPIHIAQNLIDAESSGNPNAQSNAGAMGLMQLMPNTAKMYGVTKPFDPEQNIRAGMNYLADMYKQQGSWDRALAAYNWGPGNFEKKANNQMSNIPKDVYAYTQKILANNNTLGSGPAPQAGFMPGESHGIPAMAGFGREHPFIQMARQKEIPPTDMSKVYGAGINTPEAQSQRNANNQANRDLMERMQKEAYAQDQQQAIMQQGLSNMANYMQAGGQGDKNPGFQDMSQYAQMPSIIAMLKALAGGQEEYKPFM